MFCTECGTEIAEGAKFCANCGKKLGGGVPRCKNCGAELAEGVKFCTECGTARAEGAPQTTAAETTENRAVPARTQGKSGNAVTDFLDAHGGALLATAAAVAGGLVTAAKSRAQTASKNTAQPRTAPQTDSEQRAFELHQKAGETFAAGRNQEAAALCTEALKPTISDTTRAMILNLRGTIYYTMNRYEDALRDYDECIRIPSPKPPLPYIGRGMAYNATGKYKSALADFDKAISLVPAGDSYAEIYFERGNAYLGLCKRAGGKGDTETRDRELNRAVQNFAKASEMEPENGAYAEKLRSVEGLLRKTRG
jgi:tetratricopeptide (TPR) repeat protein